MLGAEVSPTAPVQAPRLLSTQDSLIRAGIYGAKWGVAGGLLLGGLLGFLIGRRR